MTGRLIWKYLFYLILIFCPAIIVGQGVDYFWIGGSGNWSDSLNWSSENSGIPTKNDNVFFNANSFNAENQSVTIDIVAECFNMEWNNVANEPKLSGNGNLHIHSSLILSQKIEVLYNGDVYFEGNESELYFVTAGNVLKSNIYFNGGGTWNISEPIDLGPKNIYLNKGTLNTLGNAISCGSFYATSTNSKALNLNSSKVTLQGAGGIWQVSNSLSLNSGNSVIEFVLSNNISTNVFNGGGLHYNDLVFRNNGIILGGNTFERIYFSANCDYELQANKIQTINQGLFARGCAGLIDISAGQGGIATFVHNENDINISFVSLKSINAESDGGFSFSAWHSIDKGNNSGCNISGDSREMYWINNSGNWSDTTHWISSGPGEDTDCIPTLFDNVNFNEASFDVNDTVIADIEDIQCHNLNWLGSSNSVFASSVTNQTLTVNGSLQFSNSMQNLFGGIILFNDSLGGKIINTSNKIFNNDLYFLGNNGGWTIEDSLKVNGSVYLNKGHLNTNSNFISCYSFHSDSSYNRSINLGDSYVLLTKNSPTNAWSINNENMQFDAGNSIIEMEYVNSIFHNYGGDTITYNNILFSKEIGLARLYTISDVYTKFHKVDFKSNGIIFSSNLFDTLSFSPGNYYQLHSGQTQVINHDIFPTGNCNGPIVLQSSKNGTQAFIQKQNDTLTVMNAAIRDMAVSGGATFIADQSVDLGNNSGWDTIQVNAPGKLYWVGGSGDWSDQDHWSVYSGDVGGECIPTPYDTVIFDQNSFGSTGQVVNIDLNNALTHNMDWSSVGFMPEFSGSSTSANLRIFGSLTLSPEMNFSYPGYINFEAINPGQQIVTNNLKFHNVNNNVTFDGIGGEWTLMDSLLLGHALNAKNVINFNNGSLNTNGQFVKCYNFYSRYNNPRILDLDTSTICICNEWYMRGDNLLLEENNSIIRLDSGHFSHYYGNKNYYNELQLNSANNYQKVIISNADSVFFDDIQYLNKGEISGVNSVVYADNIHFQNDGFINTSNVGDENIFIIDSLTFHSTGHIYGNDTINQYLLFDSIGFIAGNGSYPKAIFNNDGNITGHNQFDTLMFSPGHFYELGSNDTLSIVDELNMNGNNCEDIILKATSGQHAFIHKEADSVLAEFIQMSNISAIGNAVFDAGYFSENIDNSNDGWLFHDSPLKYSLGNDTAIIEGESVLLCASNFNGNLTTTYEWRDCDSGEVVGTDSCILIEDPGNYCLTVYYNEGPGCAKSDEIYVDCSLKLAVDSSHVSCNGLSDGWIEMAVEVGSDPLEYYWFKDGELFAQTEDIYDLEAGNYIYEFIDSKDCFSVDSVKIVEPDMLLMDYLANGACFGENTGSIILDVTGGTEPYSYNWSNDSTGSQITEMQPGSYTIAISDDHACDAIEDTIVILELALVEFELEGTDLVCFHDSSGVINVVNLTGGTGNFDEYIWTKDGQAFIQDQQDLPQVQTGIYNLEVKDDFGCSATKDIVISEPEEIILDLEGISGNISLGAIDLTVTGGVLPYEYFWSTNETTEDVDPLGGGTYTVEVTDGNGCKSTGSIYVDVHYRIYAPTAFSPNGDGMNDEFEVFGLGTDLRSFELIIYDRWGNEVFTSDNPEYKWNGNKYNTGEVMPMEVYTWMVKIVYSTGASIIDKGSVTLLK